jgi:hypothetical protein
MRTRPLLLAVFLAAPALVTSQARAQRKGTSLHVTVADATSQAFLPDAEVTLEPLGLHRLTDFFGDARFPPLPGGVYTVAAHRIGYEPLSTLARFSGRDSLELVLLMKPASRELPDVTIEESATSPFLREFEERRRQGTGYYITDSTLRAAHGRQFEDVIVFSIPGIRYGGPVGKKILYSTRGSNSIHSTACPVMIYLNGIRVGSDPYIVPLDFIGGVEYYPAGRIPVQYQELGNDCGVMLLWPRP